MFVAEIGADSILAVFDAMESGDKARVAVATDAHIDYIAQLLSEIEDLTRELILARGASTLN